jgi:adenine-specific DNA-methyltransferase
MDFFAGSGTTFEAVCELNAQEGAKRCTILVQKDENGISSICKKRCQKISDLYNEVIKFSVLE